ncbi:MAG: hypothetical protein ACPHJ3_18295 [Rubripirellula sp.]|jgi:hypothetical protein
MNESKENQVEGQSSASEATMENKAHRFMSKQGTAKAAEQILSTHTHQGISTSTG